MRTSPSTPYSGLTIVLDEPSRFDKDYGRLLSGPARDWFNQNCLPYPYSIDSSDIRTADCYDKFLPNTRFLLLAGDKAATRFARVSVDPIGYPLRVSGIPALAVFYPQDCLDFRQLRGGYTPDDDDSAISDRDTKERIPTRRKNYRFWNQWHIKKFLSRSIPIPPPLNAKVYPRLDEICKILNSTTASEIYLDIETSRVHRCLTCIGISTRDIFPDVFVVPVYLSSGSIAYHDFHRFYRALSLALSRNEVVIHNAGFDLLVLHGFYKTCLPASVYDTMIAQHRIFPEAEKSLAHAISCWTNQPYHKDVSTEAYTFEGEKALWLYNAKDVYNLRLIKDAQLEYASRDAGLAASIAQGNASLIPYLATSLTGLRLDQAKLAATYRKLESHRGLYARIASTLVGKTFNPASSKQCANYFHDTLNYAVVSRTGTHAAALGSKQLYQLQLKYNNPLIPVILKYREVAKDASSLESELFTLS